MVTCARTLAPQGRLFVASYHSHSTEPFHAEFGGRLVAQASQGTQYGLDQQEHMKSVATMLVFRDHCAAVLAQSPTSSFVQVSIAGRDFPFYNGQCQLIPVVVEPCTHLAKHIIHAECKRPSKVAGSVFNLQALQKRALNDTLIKFWTPHDSNCF